MSYRWDTQFTDLFGRCLKRYQSGDTSYAKYYSEDDLAFLASIGYQARELFDFVEDHGDSDGTEPSLSTAVMVAAARRDYFLVVQHGKAEGGVTLKPGDLPARDSELGGYRWLPRIIAKARGKLKGLLDPEIMYGCGGDRGFLRPLDIHPADFLRVVWAAGEDDGEILTYVQENAAK